MKMSIVYDDELVPINKQNAYDVAQNNKNILFYHYKSESKYHRIKVVRQDQYEVTLVNLFCVIDTSPQTPTEQPPTSSIITEEKLDDNRIDSNICLRKFISLVISLFKRS